MPETVSGIVFILVASGLVFTALAAVARIVIGPSILDRMVASDVLLNTVLLSLGVEMIWRGNTTLLPLLVMLAATGIFATIVVARFVRRRAQFSADAQGAAAAQRGALGKGI